MRVLFRYFEYFFTIAHNSHTFAHGFIRQHLKDGLSIIACAYKISIQFSALGDVLQECVHDTFGFEEVMQCKLHRTNIKPIFTDAEPFIHAGPQFILVFRTLSKDGSRNLLVALRIPRFSCANIHFTISYRKHGVGHLIVFSAEIQISGTRTIQLIFDIIWRDIHTKYKS